MSLIEFAREYRKMMEQAAQKGLDDKEASTVPTMFPAMPTDGGAIQAGTRICWKGRVLKAAVTCWGREDNDPDHAPNLWEELAYRDGIRIIPETITVTSAFGLGERGWWKDQLYESLIDANVWTPEGNAAGWKAVAE